MIIIDHDAQECFCETCSLKYLPEPASWRAFACDAAAFTLEHVLAHRPKQADA